MPHVAGAGEVFSFFFSSLFSLEGEEGGSGMDDGSCMVRGARWRDGCLIELRGEGKWEMMGGEMR